jgi:hypothetical protein
MARRKTTRPTKSKAQETWEQGYAPYVERCCAHFGFLEADLGFPAPQVTVVPPECQVRYAGKGPSVSIQIEYYGEPGIAISLGSEVPELPLRFFVEAVDPEYSRGAPAPARGTLSPAQLDPYLAYGATFLRRHGSELVRRDSELHSRILPELRARLAALQTRELHPSAEAYEDVQDPGVRFLRLCEARFEFLRTSHGFPRRALWIGQGKGQIAFYRDEIATTVVLTSESFGAPFVDLHRGDTGQRLILRVADPVPAQPARLKGAPRHRVLTDEAMARLLDHAARFLEEHGRAFLSGDPAALAELEARWETYGRVGAPR